MARDFQLPLFEGKAYGEVVASFGGGVEGSLYGDDELLASIADLRVGDPFRYVVTGVLAAKKHALKYDKDGIEQRTLTLSLKVDGVLKPDELTVTMIAGKPKPLPPDKIRAPKGSLGIDEGKGKGKGSA